MHLLCASTRCLGIREHRGMTGRTAAIASHSYLLVWFQMRVRAIKAAVGGKIKVGEGVMYFQYLNMSQKLFSVGRRSGRGLL